MNTSPLRIPTLVLSLVALVPTLGCDDPPETTDTAQASDASEGKDAGDESPAETDSGGDMGESSASGDPSSTGDEAATGDEAGEQLGECRYYGEGLFLDNAYLGTLDFVLLAERGNGDELCRVRFTLQTVGEPELPCDDCYWSTVVEQVDPQTITDVDGACAMSERGLDAETIAAMTGQKTAIGYADESTGHGEVLLRYDEDTGAWVEDSFGTWMPDEGALTYEKVEGFCTY